MTGAGNPAPPSPTRLALRYAGFAVLATLIYWGSESPFWRLWHGQTMREVGAVLGLTAGHAIKYRLDGRCVFRD